jgi:ribosomal protein L23
MPLYAGNFAGFQSTSADKNAFRFAVNEDANLLNVNAPSAAVFVVCVRDVVTCTRTFARNETFARHGIHLPQKFSRKRKHSIQSISLKNKHT